MRLSHQNKIEKIVIAIAVFIFICAIPFQVIAQDNNAQDNHLERLPDYAAINVFGDSLMDAGNIFNLTERPPSPPYAQKFSNGPLWVEQLASELSLAPALSTTVLPNILAGKTALPVDGINFALAGSLSSDLNVSGAQLYGLQQQIESFRELSAIASPNPNTLYLLLVGGNDYNQAVRLTPSVAALAGLPDQVSNHIISAAKALIDSGARHLLIGNLPILGHQPYAKLLNQAAPQSAALLNSLSIRHNQLLAQKLDTLATTAPAAEIMPLDLAGLFSAVFDSPAQFGLSNVSDPCLVKSRSETASAAICNNPEQFLFWDDVHPTEQGHAAIAQLASQTLIAAEPQTSPVAIHKLGLLAALGSGMAIAYLAFRESH